MTTSIKTPETSPEMLSLGLQGTLFPPAEEMLPVASFDDSIRVNGEQLNFSVHYPTGTVIGATLTRVMIGGYYGCKPLYDPLAARLAGHGETVVTFSQRRHPGLKGLRSQYFTRPQRSLVEDTVALADHLHDEYCVEEYHATGHSMGGQAAEGSAEYFLDNPRPIRPMSISIVQGAGHTAHNAVSLAFESPKLLPEIKEVKAKSSKLNDHLTHDTLEYGLVNIPFAIACGVQVGNCNGDSRLARLRRHGFKIVAAYNECDPFFGARAAYQHIGHIAHQFIYGGPDHGGHFSLYLQPELTAVELSYSLEALGFYDTPQPLLSSVTS